MYEPDGLEVGLIDLPAVAMRMSGRNDPGFFDSLVSDLWECAGHSSVEIQDHGVHGPLITDVIIRIGGCRFHEFIMNLCAV